MEAGTYNFPFMFTIPTNVIIPPAGDYEFGAITYKIVSEVCRPGPEPYIRSEIVLPLISNIYVDVQNYAQPSSGTIERGLCCCCCCATDFFKLSVSVPRTGWYPGEVIPIRVEGENKSGKVIKDYTVAIVAEITLYSGPSKASIKKIINNVARTKIEEPIQPHSTFSKSHELKMPNIGPSFGLDACCAIQRRFYVACSAFYNIVCVCAPIVVGLDPADATPMALGMPAGDKSVVPTTQPDYLEKLKVCAELENAAAADAAANDDDDADVADKK